MSHQYGGRKFRCNLLKLVLWVEGNMLFLVQFVQFNVTSHMLGYNITPMGITYGDHCTGVQVTTAKPKWVVRQGERQRRVYITESARRKKKQNRVRVKRIVIFDHRRGEKERKKKNNDSSLSWLLLLGFNRSATWVRRLPELHLEPKTISNNVIMTFTG